MYFMYIELIVYIQSRRQHTKEETQYPVPGGHLPSTNAWRLHKIGLPNALVKEVGGGLNNFRVFHNNISQHM